MKHLVVVTLVVLALGGCGDEATISTNQTVIALEEAGFRNLMVLSNETAMKRAARDLNDPELALRAVDVDAILPRGRFQSFVTLRIFAVRYPSVGSAKNAHENDPPVRPRVRSQRLCAGSCPRTSAPPESMRSECATSSSRPTSITTPN